MDFKDEIQALLPNERKIIDNAVNEIKSAIRSKAMSWNKDTPFSATVYLPLSLHSEYLNSDIIYEERKGLFGVKKVPLYTFYTLNEKAHTFKQQLSEALVADGIKVKSWKLVEELAERGYGARGDYKEICPMPVTGGLQIEKRINRVTSNGITSKFQELYLLPQNIQLHYPAIALEIAFSA